MRIVRTSAALALAVIAALAACKKSEPDPKTGAGTAAGTAVGTGTAAGTAAAADAAEAPAAGDTLARPFLWKIEKDGKTGHILGTMHLGVDPARLPPVVYTQLDGAKAFAMETNIMDPSLIKALMRDDGKTLEDELGPEYWKKLEEALPGMAANLRNMKASAAASILEIQGLPMTQPMDLVLVNRAKDKGAAIVYLEEAALQQALLDKWLDARMLKMMLDERAKSADKTKEMLAAYESGDEAKLEQMSFDKQAWTDAGRDAAEFDQMMKELLLDRNASWIAPIEKMMADGDAFIAVGAAHLVGKGSVLDLLQQKGYTTTRVIP